MRIIPMANDLSFLGNKEGFNSAVRHCKKVIQYLGDLAKSRNIADVINSSLETGELDNEQINPVLGTLVVDKYGFNYKSKNIDKSIDDFEAIVKETGKWTGVDIVISYHHPKLKQCVINPKSKEHFDRVGDFAKDEIVVVYAKTYTDSDNKEVSSKAIDAVFTLLDGKQITTNKDFIKAGVSAPPKEPEKKAVVQQPSPPQGDAKKPASGKRTMTPKLSVQVSNELFHNGNVEAWKNIIQSYTTKYPTNEVVVFYDNEVINNLNALFKWGKVKMGNVIMFSVVGVVIKDVSKLKRYLFEGASSRYEKFLDKAVDKVLNLF
jgi:hypothetical protein